MLCWLIRGLLTFVKRTLNLHRPNDSVDSDNNPTRFRGQLAFAGYLLALHRRNHEVDHHDIRDGALPNRSRERVRRVSDGGVDVAIVDEHGNQIHSRTRMNNYRGRVRLHNTRDQVREAIQDTDRVGRQNTLSATRQSATFSPARIPPGNRTYPATSNTISNMVHIMAPFPQPPSDWYDDPKTWVRPHFSTTPPLVPIPITHRHHTIAHQIKMRLQRLYYAHNLHPCPHYGLFWEGNRRVTADRDRDKYMLMVIELKPSERHRWVEIDADARALLNTFHLDGRHGVCIRYYEFMGSVDTSFDEADGVGDPQIIDSPLSTPTLVAIGATRPAPARA